MSITNKILAVKTNEESAVWKELELVGGTLIHTDDKITIDFSSGVETDPVFIASAAYNITNANISNWNDAYSWGNHSIAGYINSSRTLTINGVTQDLSINRTWTITETDPVYTASSWFSTTNNSTNWNTAFSWGNHALAGYLTSETDPVFTASPSSGITNINISNWNQAFAWGDHSTVGYVLLSSVYTQTNLQTSGQSSVHWNNLTNVPSTFNPTSHTHPLGEIAQSGASLNDTIIWNGSSWIPQAPSGGGAVSSVFSRTGAVIAQSGDYNASQVTNALDSTASYNNPTWLTNLDWSKISGTPTTLTGYNISDAQPLDADLTAIAGLAGTSGLLRKTASNTWSLDTNTYLTSNQNITINGDISGSGTTAITLTLPNVNSNIGTFNNVTVNAKGQVTAASNAAYLTSNQNITLTGDVTGSGTINIATTVSIDTSKITSGVMATARLGTGTANSTTFLRGDGTWAVPSGGGGGSAWTVITKANDTARTSTATVAADPDLQFIMDANTKYAFRFAIFFDTVAAADFKWRHQGPSSPDFVRIQRQHILPGATAFAGIAVDIAFSAGDITMTGNGSDGGYIYVEGVVHNGANSGTFSFSWSQNSSNGSATTVRAGSWLEYKSV